MSDDYMKENKGENKNETEHESLAKDDKNESSEALENRRAFMKKYGVLAAVTPLALTAVMSPNRARAQSDSAGF